ncbi:MAG: GNAT family N-acetyltransferase [Rhodobacteraceae bacterium]|nr:GNAT family N-acetyltransferase [Paracoccaceae bacterium]
MQLAAGSGGFRVREARTAADIERALAFRSAVFRRGAPDRDRFDALCRHLIVEDAGSGETVACLRLRVFARSGEVADCYAGTAYDLSALATSGLRAAELGRLAIAQGQPVAEIARLALGAVTRLVDALGVELVFGCVSVAGIDPVPFAASLVQNRVPLAPPHWAPAPRSPERLMLAGLPVGTRAMALPPLLRTYLAMGARVGDHVVVDRDLGTVHVLAGLETGEVPAARAASLRALAALPETGDGGTRG